MKGRRQKEILSHSQQKKERKQESRIRMIALDLLNSNEYDKQLMTAYFDTLYLITGIRYPYYIPGIPLDGNPTHESILSRLSNIMPHLEIGDKEKGKYIGDMLNKIFYMLKNNKRPECQKNQYTDQIVDMLQNFKPYEEVILHGGNGNLIIEKVQHDELEKYEKKPEK